MNDASPRARRTRGRRHALVLALIAMASAGCLGSTGASPSPDSASARATPSVSSPAPPTDPAASQSPSPPGTAVPTAPEASPAGTTAPPGASLVGPAGGPVPGTLGTYTWSGVTSDAPWIVPRSAAAVGRTDRLRVRFDGGPAVTAWTVRWARVTDGQAGAPRPGTSGAGGPLTVGPPPGPGGWSLQVDVRFGDAGRAAWYWRVRVDR